jgi:hypothetical protein
MVWRNPFRRNVVPRRPASSSGESDISFALVLCVLVMALTFVVVLPVLGVMYMDLNNARTAVEMEIRAIRELRKQIINERMRGEP